jgi:hypothetical protein
MDLDSIRRVHDAAVALGAECNPATCRFNDVGAVDQVKSCTLERARARAFLFTLN